MQEKYPTFELKEELTEGDSFGVLFNYNINTIFKEKCFNFIK